MESYLVFSIGTAIIFLGLGGFIALAGYAVKLSTDNDHK